MKKLLALLGLFLVPWVAQGNPCQNGLYLASDWLLKARNDKDIGTLAKRLKVSGISNIYINAKGLTAESRVAKQFILDLLEQTRKVMPKGKVLSIAGYSLELDDKTKQQIVVNPAKAPSLLTWNQAYYKDVMAKVDQVMVMNYDTALRSAKDYAEFTAWQTTKLWGLAAQGPQKINLQIGLPSNVDGRTGLYDRSAENLLNGIAGVQSAFGKASCPEGLGVSIYDDTGMNPELWKSFQAAFASPTASPDANHLSHTTSQTAP